MRNEEWAKVLEKCHRKNLNKLYKMLNEDKPIVFNKTEREHLRNALTWAAEAINEARYEANFRSENEGYGPEDALALGVI